MFYIMSIISAILEAVASMMATATERRGRRLIKKGNRLIKRAHQMSQATRIRGQRQATNFQRKVRWEQEWDDFMLLREQYYAGKNRPT